MQIVNFLFHSVLRHLPPIDSCHTFIIIIIIVIIIIIITYLLTHSLTRLLACLLTVTEFSLGGSSSYTSTDKTNKNKYT